MAVRMLSVVCLVFIVSCSARSRRADEAFEVDVNMDGSYTVTVQGNRWLKSAPTFFRADGKVFSLGDGSLKLVSSNKVSGQDLVGTWQATNFLYQAEVSQIQASFYFYTPDPSIFTYNDPPLPFVLFKQTYINGANNTAGSSTEETVAGFPGFNLQEGAVSLGYLSFGGIMYGDTGKRTGQWGSQAKLTDGLDSGPLVIFDGSKTANALILSSSSSFMSASMWQNGTGSVYWGTMGGVSMLPPQFETSTVLFCSNQGINKGFASWGQILQKWYGRDDSFVKADFTNNYLGYWTDNGAYYYYKTEPSKTYQDTIVDVASYITQTGIPFRYVQFDSWWYYKGFGGGVKTWEGTPAVFPDGMEWLFNKTSLPVSAHNRWWSNDTTYANQNGGKYTFIIEGGKALPMDQSFWDDLMADGRKWGLVTYEQDWLNVEFEGVPSLVSEVGLGEMWLDQMGRAAAKNGLTVQYCMSMSRHMMQTLKIPVVTQSRASGDYHPGGENWRIGVSSLFALGLGVAPFKDNFWTITNQPGNPYRGATEPNTELNAVVATLSTGPVGPSDMIGAFNKTIIMRSINSEGLILKPSRPATAIDDMVRRLAWSDFDGPNGEVWSTYSDFGDNFKYGIILAADLSGTFSITPDLAGFQGFPDTTVFSRKDPSHVQEWNDGHPLTLSNCSKVDFCLYYASPVISFNGHQVVILGELDKWVPMSPQRVVDIGTEMDDINIRIRGGPLEEVDFWFNVDGATKRLTCTIGEGGVAAISYTLWGCLPE